MKTVEQFAREYMKTSPLEFLRWANEMKKQGVNWLMEMAEQEKIIIKND